MAIPENGRAVGAAPYSSVMSNYQRPQPNRKLMLVEFPAGTHLDRSRASSGGMRGTARDDRDNSLVAQAELFDADKPVEEGLVVHVIDGDTLDVQLSDETTRRVRLPQIDTPEMDECGYSEATSALAEIVLGEAVRLIPTQSGPNLDEHGRLLRITQVGRTDVGHLLVRSGYARWVPYFADEDPRLAAANMAKPSEDEASTAARDWRALVIADPAP